ncbi:tyrosine-type recombinase/integrase [Chamaesiphon sp. GL140_3_metabinner_50]|uniref:tyrosine-type recombinase/integrase n=1 Tax=Chamaesiphon sp. GL140_3_metabinner_50 TaxID=2970812 RepID=UPI0025F784D2|nr:tyrosine-type recombinase/integrase [Chamaesiphon sp. GL140_3_metabinner_50]
MVDPTEQQTAAVVEIDCDALIGVFTNFLQFDVANGGASGDTIVTYWTQVKQYLEWCRESQIDPREATRETIKIYRWHLTQRGYKPKTIAVKLTAVSRLYDAAVEYGLMGGNPAWGVKPPTVSIDPAARITYLEQDEATILLKSISASLPLKTLRDKLLLGVMTLEGTRSVEMHRLNIGDVVRQGTRVGLKVSSKRHTRVVPLTPQLAQVLEEYLTALRGAGFDCMVDSPLSINLSNYGRGERLSRRGIRQIVDKYLQATNLKYMEGRTLSAHSLRHTAGTLALRNGATLRQVQDLLGHADPRTTAIYAHVGDRWENNPALKVGIDML